MQCGTDLNIGKENLVQTNCNNCGGVLKDGSCPYCGAQWFKPGMTLGAHAYVTQASIETDYMSLNTTRMEDGSIRYVPGSTEYRVSLEIVGMSGEEIQNLMRRFRDVKNH